MKFSFRTNNEDNKLLGILASAAFHIFIFFAAAFLINLTYKKTVPSGKYVQMFTNKYEKAEPEKNTEEQHVKKMPVDNSNKKVKEEIQETDNNKEVKSLETGKTNYFYSFDNTHSDTTELNQIYEEPTLNVSIRYPAGWTFIDQNVKKKLDAVTFMSAKGNYNPPPYVHLEVKEKYLFNPSRYQHKMKLKNYTAYYNEPEEMAGQVQQIFYIRTDTDEDYSIKLIMKGKLAFKTFQPQFFGMIKTFRFGNSLF